MSTIAGAAMRARIRSLAPYLVVRDARRALDFYIDVFGATTRDEPIVMPDGTVGHAELAIGDSVLMLAEEFDEIGHVVADRGGAAVRVEVSDVDAAVTRALALGAEEVVAVADQGHGHSGRIRDPFGQHWIVAQAEPGHGTDEHTGARLYRRWLTELWNGDLQRLEQAARRLVADDFAGHWPGQPRLVTGPDQLASVVRQGRQMLDEVVFDVEVGPTIEGDLVAARWVGRGRYAGEPVTFRGHDLLRHAGERFVEYWVIAEDPTLPPPDQRPTA